LLGRGVDWPLGKVIIGAANTTLRNSAKKIDKAQPGTLPCFSA
jgi:hypothetical protein